VDERTVPRARGAGTADRGLLVRLFESAGYRVEDRTVGVRFRRRRDGRVVVLVDGPRSPAEVEGEFPADAVHRTLIYAEDPGAVARSEAASRGIEVLDPGTVGAALGELLLPGPATAPGVPTVDEEGGLEPPAAVYPEGDHYVVPRYGRAEALAIAGREGVRCTLRLVPFYVAPYRVREASPHGGTGPPQEHLVAVHALQGRVEVWERGDREITPTWTEPHEQLEPTLDPEGALRLARASLQRRHAVSVDHTEQVGGTLVIERRRVPPGEGDLKLGPLARLLVPYWYLEGTDGRVVLDAVTGRRVEADPGAP
jgi:hypothetical protein